MKNTYTCKCGYTFSKNTEANITALRLSEHFEKPYGEGHPCYGCPYIKEQTVWNRLESNDPQNIKVCYAAQHLKIEHISFADSYHSSGSNLCLHTNDLDFIGEVFEVYARELSLLNEDFTLYQTQDDPEGRCTFSLSFPKNALGEKCKKDIIDAFFESIPPMKYIPYYKYRRIDFVFADVEHERCVERINYFKRRYELMDVIKRVYLNNDEADPSYLFVKKISENRYRVHKAASLSDIDNDDKCFPCFVFSSAKTFEDAQIGLDRYAEKHGFSEVFLPEEESQLPPGGFDELYEAQIDEEIFEENVSDEEQNEEEIILGETVSLKSGVFDKIFQDADEALQTALKVMLETKEKFDLNLKISFYMIGGLVRVKNEVGYKFEPINHKKKDFIDDDLEIVINSDGELIFPNDRPRQLTMNDINQNDLETDVITQGDGLVEKILLNEVFEDEGT